MKKIILIFIFSIQILLCQSQNYSTFGVFDTSKINISNCFGKQGVWISGSIPFITKATFFNNILNGKYELFLSEDTLLASSCNFKLGVLDGTYQSYYDNGKIQLETNLNDGIINGVTTYYGYNGELLLKYKMVNGIFDTTYKETYINDSIKLKFVNNLYGNFQGFLNKNELFPKIDTLDKYIDKSYKKREIFINDKIHKVQFFNSEILTYEIYFLTNYGNKDINVDIQYLSFHYYFYPVMYETVLIKKYSFYKPNLLKKIYIGQNDNQTCQIIYLNKKGKIKKIRYGRTNIVF